LSALQRSFVSMASHEFRTPLAIIDGNAQRLERRLTKMTEDDVSTRIKKIRKAVNRMASLMESTLDASKMEAGTIEITPVPTDIRSLLIESCEAQREIAAKHEIALDDTGLPDQITADPKAITQVFGNLLSNAVKYSPDADRIEIRSWQDANDVFISVRDYGLGMDEDDLRKLFSRYFRAKTSVGIAGTGIGLNLVKMLVEGHGGRITVTSVEQEGSEFVVRLPKAGPSSIAKTAA
jgi:signal transduction histidine kinase